MADHQRKTFFFMDNYGLPWENIPSRWESFIPWKRNTLYKNNPLAFNDKNSCDQTSCMRLTGYCFRYKDDLLLLNPNGNSKQPMTIDYL